MYTNEEIQTVQVNFIILSSTLRYKLEEKGNNKIEINIMVSYICKLVNIYLKLQIKKKVHQK